MIKIKQELIELTNNLDEKEKLVIYENLILSIDNLTAIFGMKEPWLLILDNQILMDLVNKEVYKNSENERRRYLRLLAIYLTFEFLTKYICKNIAIIITPCTFFEFNKREIPKNNREFSKIIENYTNIVSEFQIPIDIFEDCKNYRNTKSILKQIRNDEQKIIQLIQKLKNNHINADLYTKLQSNKEKKESLKVQFFKPPVLIGYQIASQQKLNLKYFDRELLNRAIACHIEDNIYRNNAKSSLTKKKD